MTTSLGKALSLVLSSGAGEAPATFLGLPYGVWQTVNLVLFVALLVYLLKKPLTEALGKRRREVVETLEKAAADRRRAEEIAAELGQRLTRIEADLVALRAQAEAQASRELGELEASAEEDARRIVARASAEMENRVRSARNELTSYAADLAVDIAREVLAKAVTPDDRERLFREAVTDLASRSAR